MSEEWVEDEAGVRALIVSDWRLRAQAGSAAGVRTGNDPRWRKSGTASELGVMSGLRWALWLAQTGVPIRTVPSAAWALDGEAAIVACPCGNTPAVEKYAAPAVCKGEHECGRSFFFTGEHVYCFNSPTQDQPNLGRELNRLPLTGGL